ncbi:amidohydrolase [Rehaibacterium terrae]|jgi:amidohydrolase|uniref:Amidohydrolase n=1 Tax=Rehaibacterium terrae TaxID=1341696 RepID=A0A7W7Y009_9GAMM|nr:amidohydrolase [Rehaibacterium terrae]MBB5015575.1 amidohydrolase [Rehaibacterium terrae]
MRLPPLAAALLAVALTPAASAHGIHDIESLAAAVDARVLEWRRDIHQHPELSNREFRTAALVADHLRSLGLEPRTGIAHTGVVAILRGGKPGPRIALRADMDALPVSERVDLPFASRVTTEFRGETVGVMHACGHDAHTAILMGVAEALTAIRDELAGEVMFIFQPAEEGPPEGEDGGAPLMLEQGLFADFRPEAIFGLHVWANLHAGQVGYRSGPFMASSDQFRIVVKGRQTHGSRPWGGIDPIVAAADLVTSAQTIVSRNIDITRLPVVLSFGAIKGGIRHNIIPDQVELIGTIRAFDDGMREQVFRRLGEIAEHVGHAHGAQVEHAIPTRPGNPVTVNDPALTARALPSLQRVLGADKVRENPLITGAEDFSYFAREVPGFYWFVGASPAGSDLATVPNNHSPEFFLDEEALKVGTRTLLAVTLDYLAGTR